MNRVTFVVHKYPHTMQRVRSVIHVRGTLPQMWADQLSSMANYGDWEKNTRRTSQHPAVAAVW